MKNSKIIYSVNTAFVFFLFLLSSDSIFKFKLHKTQNKNILAMQPDSIPVDLKLDSNYSNIDSLNKCCAKTIKLETTLKNVQDQLNNSTENYNSLINSLKRIYSVKGNRAFTLNYKNKSFDCYEVDLINSEISFYLKDSRGNPISSLEKVNKILSEEKKMMVFAVNGGMYTKEQNPQGLFIQQRKLITKIDKRTGLYGNFYLQPNGIFYIDTCNIPGVIATNAYNEDLEKYVEFATQSGPMLVIDSKINSNFKEGSENLNVRNGVGLNDKGKLIFVISNDKVNFFDFGDLFLHKLKCDNALYLDGAISETFLPEIGRFQNGGMFGPIIAINKKQ